MSTHSHLTSFFRHILFRQETNFREPVHKWTNEEKAKLGLRYYNADVHRAAFTLPEFARQVGRATCFVK